MPPLARHNIATPHRRVWRAPSIGIWDTSHIGRVLIRRDLGSRREARGRNNSSSYFFRPGCFSLIKLGDGKATTNPKQRSPITVKEDGPIEGRVGLSALLNQSKRSGRMLLHLRASLRWECGEDPSSLKGSAQRYRSYNQMHNTLDSY